MLIMAGVSLITWVRVSKKEVILHFLGSEPAFNRARSFLEVRDESVWDTCEPAEEPVSWSETLSCVGSKEREEAFLPDEPGLKESDKESPLPGEKGTEENGKESDKKDPLPDKLQSSKSDKAAPPSDIQGS